MNPNIQRLHGAAQLAELSGYRHFADVLKELLRREIEREMPVPVARARKFADGLRGIPFFSPEETEELKRSVRAHGWESLYPDDRVGLKGHLSFAHGGPIPPGQVYIVGEPSSFDENAYLRGLPKRCCDCVWCGVGDADTQRNKFLYTFPKD